MPQQQSSRQPQAAHEQSKPATTAPTYQKPEIMDLGPWQNVTLIYSLPIGPGSLPNPLDSSY